MGLVLATPEAVDQAGRMRQIIGGGLASELGSLNTAAAIVADPSKFEGRHAGEFRAFWQQAGPRLQQARQDLEELAARVEAIATDIIAAGGGAR